MTVLGRINGPMLKENLERQGVDLAFETDLLYLDVNNNRIGINKSIPTEELDVNGNILVSNNFLITATGFSSIATNADIVLDPNGSGRVVISYLTETRIPFVGPSGSITDDANLTFDTDTLTTVAANAGNLRIANNDLVSTDTNGNINITPNGTGLINSTNLAVTSLTSGRIVFVGPNGTLIDDANLTFDGTNITIAGNISLNSAIIDNVSFNGNTISTVNTNENLNIAANGSGSVIVNNLNVSGTSTNSVLFTDGFNLITTDSGFTYDSLGNILQIGNLALFDNSIESTVTNSNLNLITNGAGSIVLNASSSLQLPSGNISQRPFVSVAGMIRWNTTDSVLEYYDGSSWVALFNNLTTVTSDTFNGDGSTLSFTLSQSTTTAGVIVSINGVLQKPSVAYNVTGTQLIFLEAPGPSDIIEARIMVTAITFSSITDGDTFLQLDDGAPNIVLNVNGSPSLTLTPTGATFIGDITTTTGYFIGDGSQLTNIPPATSVTNGNSNVVVDANSNVRISVNGTPNVVVVSTDGITTSGDLRINGNDIKSSTGNAAITLNDKDVTVQGNLTVKGVSTTIGTSDLTIEDSIVNLHTLANLAPLTVDDGRDIGLRFHYFKTSTDNHAFIGWKNSSGYLEYYQTSTETGGVISGDYGIIKANAFISNIATGTAPLTINSTTQVANLNVAVAGSLINGNSNIVVDANANVRISANGVSNVVVVTGTGANITGTANISGNANTGNLGTTTLVATTGNITTVNSGLVQNGNSNVAITANGNISTFIGGNATAQLVVTSTGANIAGTANITTGNITTVNSGLVQNGNSNVAITANGNVTITATSNATLVVTSTGANIAGTANVTGNFIVNGNTLYVDSVNNRVGIGNGSPGSVLTVSGLIESTTGGVKFPDGLTAAVKPFTSMNIQSLTSGTTYTPTSGTRSAIVIATGAGGGGGGADGNDNASGSGGGGGGAGATVITVYTAAQLGATATYSIGTGGTAGSGTNGTNGGNGGNTTFTPAGTGTAITANGGALGTGGGVPAVGSSAAGGAGGTGSGGLFNVNGGDGGSGTGDDAAELAIGGVGGSSFWGGGGTGGTAQAAAATAGVTGKAHGSGGGGGSAVDTTTGSDGAAGKDGVIFVLEFI